MTKLGLRFTSLLYLLISIFTPGPSFAGGGTWNSVYLTVQRNLIPLSIYLPENFNLSQRYPAILFLHGAMERGDDGEAAVKVGIGPALERFPERYPAIVLIPQLPKGLRWAEPAGQLIAENTLEYGLAHLPIDKNRFYLTGVSMGAYGAWELALRHPDFFAAFSPMATDREAEPAMTRLANTPIWMFQGDRDELMPIEPAREILKMFKKLENLTEVRLTKVLGAGHAATWDKAYAHPDFTAWLFQQTKAHQTE